MYKDPQILNDFRQTSGTDFQNGVIGAPQSVISGQFEGKTIRAELQELQKAELGRKYARVDRRPLDPPPVTKTTSAGLHFEKELTCDEIRNLGIMCTVDLFPVPEQPGTSGIPAGVVPPNGYRSGNYHGYTESSTLTYYPLHPFKTSDINGREISVSPFQIPRRQPVLSPVAHNDPPKDVVHRFGNHLITESSKMTPALVGEKFIEPTQVDYKGQKALVFVFGDLAVQREGTFILRYRVFDIFSRMTGDPEDPPLMAEVFGGPFRVYSTREFPGLEPSTDLTRSLSKYGVRVTLRDAERKSKKRT
ncbi:velvet factor-domain-containing protein [Ephemerocybe angulata]|uniref:Velvet factor-domain-containing protein n=1 Tax=Ephemerocybe angulata TaxID=980116 RepID=A0A8H6I9J4_9AGAR|nr:velvet factor-domain-containing protein [Tulosesus angulatus]